MAEASDVATVYDRFVSEFTAAQNAGGKLRMDIDKHQLREVVATLLDGGKPALWKDLIPEHQKRLSEIVKEFQNVAPRLVSTELP